ncbi:TIGR03943 family protein [Amycolatopsis sp. K13G38]|uniref:TIGR03943 family protein n=1 Tax=Amycolatopsis acididurans TaxID=2724524 RepID=A0ABX1J692_9PSEU|nr:TIGR03943 family protein [Amycolatopsis acididurans]NKQ53885.1 TIGR03943 family protein [Amycolatopsis acididurans]
MRRETQNVLLVLLGGALLKIGFNGDYLRYVKPAQLPWLLAGGAVMVALGAIAIVRDILAARAGRTVGHGDGHGHHHPARSAWLLVVPVLAVFLVAPPALGAYSVTRSEARPAVQSSAAFPPLPPGDPLPMTMTQFVTRAGWDAGGSLDGRTVELTGFVSHDKGSALLARMVITCCAADAYPLKVRLVGRRVAAYADDTWLQVTGQVVPNTATRQNSYTADFVVGTAKRISAPQNPYED